MIAATQLRLIVVTPEKTLLDATVTSVVFPLFDGQLGVLPGRAPLIGRLGAGELRFEGPGGAQRYFVDGGFVQVKGSVVSLLTHRAQPVDTIDIAAAERDLTAANEKTATKEQEFIDKRRAQERARRMIALRRGR